jgi:hypothetical protein
MMKPTTALLKRITVTAFENQQAQVLLEGQPIATLIRTPGWLEAKVLGRPYGGGKTLTTALRSVAVAYTRWSAP